MNILAAFNVLKDMAISGAAQAANPPSSLQSVNGVPVPIDKSAIVQTYNASNGIVYVMSSVNFNVADKITPIIIQGENPSFFARTDQKANIAYRTKIDPNNVKFNDILIAGSTVPAQFFAAYKLSNLYTCRYQVVIRALNDIAFSSPTNINETVKFGQITATTLNSGTIVPTTLVNYPAFAVLPSYYDESTLTGATGSSSTTGTINVSSGSLNVLKYSSINMYVVGANATGNNNNNVTFDYIKLIPILQ